MTISSFTMMSGGSFSPAMTFTALSTAALPISYGNCATVASIVPASIAFFASSSASKPTTRILPVLPAAAIASIAPSAIRSLAANTVSMSRMRLQHVLKHVEALIALPVRRLRRDDA